jgi:hypothetical protein
MLVVTLLFLIRLAVPIAAVLLLGELLSRRQVNNSLR